MLARRAARHEFKARIDDAFGICNDFLNGKHFNGKQAFFANPEKEPWFFEHELHSDFVMFGYYAYRQFKFNECPPKKYRDMAELYREICISQDSCAEARESRQGMCSGSEASVNEAQAQEPTARAMRAAGRV
jgi:hypothetical protein